MKEDYREERTGQGQEGRNEFAADEVPAEPPALKDRLRWLGRMLVMAFLLVAAGFLSFVVTVRFAIQGREVRVPSVVGVQAGVAQEALAGRGLSIRVADRVFSDLPVDYVVRQSPAPGTEVKTMQRVHVVLSLGPQRVSIPDLEGKSLRAARVELLRTGLQLGEVSSVHLPDRPVDVVIKQNPPPRATNAGGPRVNLLVSLGPREPAYVMPDLTGLAMAEVPRRVSDSGLRIGRVHVVEGGGAQRNTVIAQVPQRGRRIPAGTVVELQVAQ